MLEYIHKIKSFLIIMAFLFNLFKKTTYSEEYKKVISFNNEFNSLLTRDSFISRKDYKEIAEKYLGIFDYYANQIKANTLKYYCKREKIKEQDILDFYDRCKDLVNKDGSSIVKKHNEVYVQNHLVEDKNYLDTILSPIDKKIMLDEEQRKVVLSDEDYTLVIAGAGAGKTTTVAAKVRYLVEKQGVKPEQILVISFTNKAVGELQERINTQLNIKCPITTFHSTGLAILRKQDEEKKLIAREGMMFNVIMNYIKGKILDNPELVDKLILFFGSYFDMPYGGVDIHDFFNYIAKGDYSTLRSNVNDYCEKIIDRRTGKNITINNEILRSAEEVRIANFLYLNGIDYVYEEPYQYHILKAKKIYTPDFCIRQGDKVAYIEHFGITESGHHSFYTTEELDRYKKAINEKILLHRKHGTTLLYTFSRHNDGRDYLDHLKDDLLKAGFEINKKDSREVLCKIVNTEENRYIVKLVCLICDFINNFKADGYDVTQFSKFEQGNANVRTKLFMSICKSCYVEYQTRLSEKNMVDFADMINDSARMLEEKAELKEKLDFKYIIVDEYQDISRQRFDLTNALSKVCDAKIIAVGDDWQSIYAFSGSDITLFTHFKDIMGYADELKITRTYRNAQEVIDIAGNFIQKNDSQIKKSLVSPKHISKPVVIYSYTETVDRKLYAGKGGKYFLLGKKVEEVIGKIIESNRIEGRGENSTILLIGRYGFDAKHLCFSRDFVYDENNNKLVSKKYPRAKLEFLTAHSSKGLGYDNVLVINARNEMFGFPAKLEDDVLMKYVVREDNSMEYAEERRLFYVAMTRTKNRIFFVTPTERPSEFILELIRDYDNIKVYGDINKDKIPIKLRNTCPICGYPLQVRANKNYGLNLWICTNEPEICDFMTNEPAGGIMSVQKCNCCKDGYLIVKRYKDNKYMLGCTNYKSDGTGCGNVIEQGRYKAWTNDVFEEDESVNMPAYIKEIKPQEDRVVEEPVTENGEVLYINNVDKEEKVPELDIKQSEVKERKKPTVHTTQELIKKIENEGFKLVADDEGNIITDIELLIYLRKLGLIKAKEEGKPAYIILHNPELVTLATFRPENKNEFLKLKGLGEVLYNNYGDYFISGIKEYYEKNK